MKLLLYLFIIVSLYGCVSFGNSHHNDKSGKSVYDIWLENGHSGTEQDFLNSLNISNNDEQNKNISQTEQNITNELSNNTETPDEPVNKESDNTDVQPNNTDIPDEPVNNESDNTDVQSHNTETPDEPTVSDSEVVTVVVPEYIYPVNIAADYHYKDFNLKVINAYNINQYSFEKDYDIKDTNSDAAGTDFDSTNKYKQILYEKEMQLANYGVGVKYNESVIDEFGNTEYLNDTISVFIHNREGIGVNAYVPESGAVFTGNTMAYIYTLDAGAKTDYMFLYGDAEYNFKGSDSTLTLAFNDFYTFVLDNNGNVSVYNTNGVNNSMYNLTVGENINNTGVNDSKIDQIGFLRKDNIEESVGTYRMNLEGYKYQNDIPIGVYNPGVNIEGAFGGTKQSQ